MAAYALTPSLRRLRSALVIVSVEPDRRTPTRNLYTPVTRKLMRFGSVVVLESGVTADQRDLERVDVVGLERRVARAQR